MKLTEYTNYRLGISNNNQVTLLLERGTKITEKRKILEC